MRSRILAALVLVAVLTVGIWAIVRFSGRVPAPPPPLSAPAAAYQAAQGFVLERLKAPATAQFEPIGDAWIRELEGGRFRISAWVDAQNEFGAMIRTKFEAIVAPEGETWSLVSLSTEP